MHDYFSYIKRYILWNAINIDDYKRFPSVTIRRGESILSFSDKKKDWTMLNVRYRHKAKTNQRPLEELLVQTGTTAFIVIQGEAILFEGYFNGYHRNSINTSFSMAKSITSCLIGVAINEGQIKSVEEPIINYLPELNEDVFKAITIRHLLNMCSGLSYKEGILPWKDDPKIYYHPNLRTLALHNSKLIEPPGMFYHYNNFNVLLLGLILERATRQSVAHYLREKIWKNIGAEGDASWSVDSNVFEFAKMESGVNALAIDFARFGYMYLNNGLINNKQLLPNSWVKESVSPPSEKPDTQKYAYVRSPPLSSWVSKPNGYYKYLWWGNKIDDVNYDFFAMGVLGQFIYVAPRKRIVIVRLGKKWGEIDWYPDLFKEMVDKMS